MITPQDDYLHPKTDDPFWNESAWFSLMIPERNLCGWAYLHHRPNMNYSVGGYALWDGSGEYSHDCLYFSFGDPFPMKPEFEMFDFRLPNGFEMNCLEPFKQFRFRNHAEECELDLTWTAFMEPVEPGFPLEWGPRHYEQGGRMKGTIRVEGEELEVDCWSQRDRSWGPRTVSVSGHPRSGFPWAVADENNAFIIFPVGAKPAKDDPAYGETDKLIAGWYLKDGKVGRVVDGQRTIPERGPDGRPLRTEMTAVDEHGRTLEAEATWTNWLAFCTYPFLFEWWSLAEWKFDGFTAWGEDEEFWPLQPARRFLRSHRRALAAS
jgi:hypothetical protein